MHKQVIGVFLIVIGCLILVGVVYAVLAWAKEGEDV